jgi:hypothetical protein
VNTINNGGDRTRIGDLLMTQQDADFWARARRAQDKLVAQFLDHPDVSLIDIGYAEEGEQRTDTLAIRIHVRDSWFNASPEKRVNFPDAVDDISVVVIRGDYGLQDTLDSRRPA